MEISRCSLLSTKRKHNQVRAAREARNIFFISQSDYLIYDVLFPGLAWEWAIRELRNLIRESRTSTGLVKKSMGAASAEHTYEQFRAVLCKTKA